MRTALRVLFIVLITYCTYAVVGKAVESRTEEQCKKRMERIGVRLDYFFFRTVPPSHLVGKDGKATHSWRTLFAAVDEFAEGHKLPIDFDKSPVVSDLDTDWARQFRCPGERADDAVASYAAITGKETMWPPNSCVTIPNGIKSDHALVIDLPEARIRWGEPKDVTVEELWQLIKSPNGQGITSPHPAGRPYLAIDGTVRYLPKDTTLETLRRLVQRDPRCQVIPCNSEKFVDWLKERWTASNPLSYSEWLAEQGKAGKGR